MTTKPPARRADDMTAEEVKQFWHGFCERKKIDEDPEYWADQTMMKLVEAVST